MILDMERLKKYYASRSYWLESSGDDLSPRPKLKGTINADIAILGAGFTGLWTAYYLLKQNPELKIVILEKHIAGYGASGRNGGWCSHKFSLSPEICIERFGEVVAKELQLAMFDSVKEVEKVIEKEKLNVDWKMPGSLKVAVGEHLLPQLEQEMEANSKLGLEKYFQLLNEDQTSNRVKINGVKGSLLAKTSAILNPGKLARQLARVLETYGVQIYEQSKVIDFKSGSLTNDPKLITLDGSVKANVAIVIAGDSYLSQMRNFRRRIISMYTSIVLTEPLSKEQWSKIGWKNRESVGSNTLSVDYLHKTSDGRILFGIGNISPYRFRSHMSDKFDTNDQITSWLKNRVCEWFPSVSKEQITHSWGGPIGVTSDWTPNITFDPQTKIANAWGYFGQGVSTANLAGRILTDLINEKDSKLIYLPMVQHNSSKWVPEPFRWMGARYIQSKMLKLDKRSEHKGIAPKGTTLAEKLSRH